MYCLNEITKSLQNAFLTCCVVVCGLAVGCFFPGAGKCRTHFTIIEKESTAFVGRDMHYAHDFLTGLGL